MVIQFFKYNKPLKIPLVRSAETLYIWQMFSGILKLLILISAIYFLLFGAACHERREVNQKLNLQMPDTILWAWERPEDLRFLDSDKFGVAFLAQTLYLQNDDVIFRPRRQPLEVLPSTYLIAVTRIETDKDKAQRPTLSDAQKGKIVAFIKRSLELPNVKAVQIDFDVVVSERKFYKKIVGDLRKELSADVPLTITSLASWCVGDSWFDDFPVDEVVPMAFRMGADSARVRSYLAAGNDWKEPLCLGSYGVSLDESLKTNFKTHRRVYYFNAKPWTKSDLEKLNQ